MNTSKPWFRMYARFITDPVVEELSFEDQRHFVFLLCMKCDGLLDKDFPSKEMRERAIARRLGLQGEAFTNARARLVASGLIDAAWQPTNWDRLQYASDTDSTAAERKRKQRERERAGTRPAPATPEIVTRDVTDASRVTGCDSHGEVTRTDTDTDTDTDTEQRESYARASPEDVPRQTTAGLPPTDLTVEPDPVPFDGWQFMAERLRPAYPRGTFRHQHWLLAARAVERVVAAGADPDEIAANAAAYQRQQEAMGNEGTQFILAPSKWLETDAWRGPFPLPDAPRRGGGEDPDAVQAWERLIATDGAERPPAAQIALQAVGGWPRVKERTIRETPILRREFISAFTTASHAA